MPGWPVAFMAARKGEPPGRSVETAVIFPGLPAIVPSVRKLVRGILADSPRAEDMELITAELVSNAIRRSPAGQDGGEFTVTVRTGHGWARIEVSDTGTGEWNAPQDEDPDAEYGRGLAIVAALVDKLGHDITASGQTVWAEVGWGTQWGKEAGRSDR